MDTIFKIPHTKRWRCQDCGVTNVRRSHEYSLAISMVDDTGNPLNLTLVELIQRHYQPEQMQIRCESTKGVGGARKCKGNTGNNNKVRSRRALIVGEPPQVLVLQLLRFTMNSRGINIKLSNDVPFEPILDMTPFTSAGAAAAAAAATNAANAANANAAAAAVGTVGATVAAGAPGAVRAPLNYRLDGIVAHEGATMDRGHLIAVTRHPDNPTGAVGYSNIDDMVVTGDGWPAMRHPRAGRKPATPYLFFYTRV